MKKLAVLVGSVAVAVLATAALTGSAAVRKPSSTQRQQVVSLQKQINELRSELICLEAVAGDGYSQDWWIAKGSNATSAVTPQTPVNDRGVCVKLGIKQRPPTDSTGALTQPFTQLINRAFGR